jgi:hypothetical protein
MSQGFRPSKPAFLDPLQSQPMRDNFNALATHNAGATSPPNPDTGWLWLDTSNPANYRLRMYLLGTWIIILNNLVAGFPSQGGATKVVHNQTVAATTWTITHNLNTPNVSVFIWDGSLPAQMILPNTVVFVNNNVIQATFLVAQSGYAVVIG